MNTKALWYTSALYSPIGAGGVGVQSLSALSVSQNESLNETQCIYNTYPVLCKHNNMTNPI
jgi:hypothetical protein